MEIKWKRIGEINLHYRPNSTHVAGFFRYPRIPATPDMNDYQHFLFRRAIFGTEVYSREELDRLNPAKIKRIISVHKHAVHVLNLYRQKVLIRKTDALLKHLFYATVEKGAVKDLISGNRFDFNRDHQKIHCETSTDPKFKCKLSYEALGITRAMMVDRLLEAKVLPSNFRSLSIADDPRLKQLANQKEELGTL